MLLHKLSGLTLLVTIASVTAAANSTCYYPNGEKNKGGACNPNAETSVCCGPTFTCLGNGLCQVGPDTRRTYGYEFYRSGCTDASFNSSSCPQFCLGSGFNIDRGQGVKKCGETTYCCGESGDCCEDSTKVFTLGAADVITTISPSYATSTASSLANVSTDATSTQASESNQEVDHQRRTLAIGLGLSIGLGGLLLVALVILYVLKRRAKAKSSTGLEEEKDITELEASWRAQLPDSLPEATKTGYTIPQNGVVHELASTQTGSPTGAQEMEANTVYDWEPRNEPQPRDGGFRPEEHLEHRAGGN